MTNGKVLVISSPFFNYQISIAQSFSRLGFDVHIETYDEPVHPFKGWLRWQHKLSWNKEKLKEKNRQDYKPYIERVFDKIQPEYVFIYNGAILKDDTLDYFREKNAKVIIWMYDSIFTNPVCQSHIDHVDLFCCFEQRDVDFCAAQGKKAYFLPSAYDPNVYFPIDNQQKTIDIIFIGNIYRCAKRKNILENLVRRYPEKKIRIYGEYKPYFKNPFTWATRTHRDIFLNHNVPPAQANALYSQAKIALNIHQAQSVFGANPRLFEICGAGAYQITDTTQYISSLFKNGEVGLYSSQEELYERIDYALSHDMSENAQKAHEIVAHKHTFDARVEQMLAWMQK